MRVALSRRRAPFVILAIAGLISVAACGDSRIKQLQVGISRDSMLRVLAQGSTTGDSLPFVYRHNSYLVSGKYFDVFYYDPKDRNYTETRQVRENEVVPIFVVDGVVEGWGWDYSNRLYAEYKIPSRADLLK